jgi:hypothetical protein
VDVPTSTSINSASVIGTGTAGEPGAIFHRTASTTEYFAAYSSTYNGLQIKLDRRFAGGLLITTSFSWQKALGYQSDDDGGLTFFINQLRNYAPTDFDRQYGFVQSYVYQLPFGYGKKWMSSGLVSRVLGNWEVSGILTLDSGIPFYVTANGGSLNSPGSTQTANLIAPVTYPKGINIGNPWFSTTSFAQPVGVVFGNVGRNDIFGPGLFGLNLSLFKHFKVTERFNVEIRGEAFQITNSPQFNNPSSSLTSSTFGYVNSTLGSGSGVNGTGGGRAIQLGAKVTF